MLKERIEFGGREIPCCFADVLDGQLGDDFCGLREDIPLNVLRQELEEIYNAFPVIEQRPGQYGKNRLIN